MEIILNLLFLFLAIGFSVVVVEMIRQHWFVILLVLGVIFIVYPKSIFWTLDVARTTLPALLVLYVVFKGVTSERKIYNIISWIAFIFIAWIWVFR